MDLITMIKYIVWRFVLKTIALDSNCTTSRKCFQDMNTFATTLHSLVYCRRKCRSHPTPISFRACTCPCLCHVLESINIIHSFHFELIDPWHEKAVIQVKWTRYIQKNENTFISLFTTICAYMTSKYSMLNSLNATKPMSQFFFYCGTDNREVGLSKRAFAIINMRGAGKWLKK